jgi:hypothetical protein
VASSTIEHVDTVILCQKGITITSYETLMKEHSPNIIYFESLVVYIYEVAKETYGSQ